MTRDTLPLTTGHFHPRISPTLMNIHRRSRCIGALSLEDSRCDGRIAKDSYNYIFVLGADLSRRFR